MLFHDIYASSNLSGLNVILRDGIISADNMSLSKNSLIFKEKDETIENKQEILIKSTGATVTQIYKSNNNEIVTIENNLDSIGLRTSYQYTRNNIFHDDGTYIGVAGTFHLRNTDDEGRQHTLFMNPSELNVSTTHFSFMNKGSVSVEGMGVTLNTSSSGLRLKGDMINTSTGGYINKYLKVFIYDEVTNSFLPYNIPLMSAI